MLAFKAVVRMSALVLFFIFHANNIVYSNAQPTLAPTASSSAQLYTVTQVSDTEKNCTYHEAKFAATDVLKHTLLASDRTWTE